MTDAARAPRLRVADPALVAGAAGALVGLIAGLVFVPDRAPLWGTGSVGVVAGASTAISGGAVFAVVYIRAARRTVRWRLRVRWRLVLDIVGLSIAAAGVALLFTESVFAVLELAFHDLSLDRLSSSVVLAVTGLAACDVLAGIAAGITTRSLAAFVALFLTAGVFGSMLTASDASWWRYNFSTLGTGPAPSAGLFDLTLAIAGLVMTTLADYLTTDLRARRRTLRQRPSASIVIRILMIALGIALLGVGAVPLDVNHIVHDVFAYGLMFGFLAFIVVTPILVPGLPRAFMGATFGFIAVLISLMLLYIPIGYLNLTAVELLAVVTVFGWVTLFARTIGTPVPARQPGDPAATRVIRVRRRRRGPIAAIVAGIAAAFAIGWITSSRSRR
jgi:hypothetical protein